MWQKLRCFLGLHEHTLQPNGIIFKCAHCSHYRINETRILEMKSWDIINLWINDQIAYDQFKTAYTFAKENRTWL